MLKEKRETEQHLYVKYPGQAACWIGPGSRISRDSEEQCHAFVTSCMTLDSMINGRKWSNRLLRGLGVDWREWSKDSNTFIASIIFCCMITTMYIYNKAHCGVLTDKKCNKK